MPPSRIKAPRLFCLVVLAAVVSHIASSSAQETVSGGRTSVIVPNAVALLQKIEATGLDDIYRDLTGNIVKLTLRQGLANDQNLALVSEFYSLQRLVMSPSDRDNLTEKGISSLGRLTNLVSLHIDCSLTLSSGVFREVCKLKQLRYLGLNAACPPADEYSSITNLHNLAELRVTRCANFADQELTYLTNLVHLKELILYSDGFSREGTNVLRTMGSLTNVVVKVSDK